jgi:hypothetical protein
MTLAVMASATVTPNLEMLGAKQSLSFVEEIEQPEQTKELINEPILFPEITYKVFYDIDYSQDFLNMLYSEVSKLDLLMASDEYTIEATDKMLQEKSRLLNIIYKVENDIKLYALWEDEYYYATKTWQFLKQHGYSDAVVSGIIGNMMIETGGRTLKLSPNIYDTATGRYYGLCQWSLKYKPEVEGMSFEEQLTYLVNSIEQEFNVFGSRYYEGFTYNDFLKLSSPSEAALAFAKVYERCASKYYGIRQTAAEKAYSYFDLTKNIE